MNLLLLFLLGVFVANGIPHFVHGISGRKFPTPFAKPPGRGLSPSIVNVLWGIFNFLVAIVLYVISDGLSLGLNAGFITFGVGFVLTSVGLSIAFQRAERDV
jgi:hypothetical protein